MRSPKRSWCRASSKSESVDPEERDPFQLLGGCDLEPDALDFADSLEKGLVREILTEFMIPVASVQGLQRFNVLCSEDMMEHRLLSHDYTFLLYARTSLEARKVDIFSYDPKQDGEQLFQGSKPAFSLAFGTSRAEWRLVREQCEHCRFSPKHVSCLCQGKQQVAFGRHFTKKLGNGVSNCMDVIIPGLQEDGTPAIWCPRLGKTDLASPKHGANKARREEETETLVSRCPTWNEEVECLVLDFAGRTVQASPKNFQLALPGRPEEVVCQYGKMGPTTFSLDFKGPLSVVQAFGVALSTAFLV